MRRERKLVTVVFVALGRLGGSLVRLCRFDEAAAPLAEAGELFAALRARPFIAEADELLERATAAAS